jgi:hypothetical protein
MKQRNPFKYKQTTETLTLFIIHTTCNFCKRYLVWSKFTRFLICELTCYPVSLLVLKAALTKRFKSSQPKLFLWIPTFWSKLGF